MTELIVAQDPTPTQERETQIRSYLIRPASSDVRFIDQTGGITHLRQLGTPINRALCGTTALTGWHVYPMLLERLETYVCKRCARIAQATHGFTVQEVEELA